MTSKARTYTLDVGISFETRRTVAFDRVRFVSAQRPSTARRVGTRFFRQKITFFVWVSDRSGVAHAFIVVERVVRAMGVGSTSGTTRWHGDG